VELLDGKHVQMPPSTRLLTVEDFTAYVERVKVWASQFLGLAIPEANQVEAIL
jgi:hypothetical protein